MIDRRREGFLTLHTLGLGAEAVILWRGMAALSWHQPFYTYVSLLAPWTYSVSIAVGLAFAMRYLSNVGGSLVTLGWVGAARLAIRQVACVACAVFALAVASKDVGLSRVFVCIYFSAAFLLFVVANRFQPQLLVRIFLTPSSKIPMLLMGRAENFPGLSRWLAGQRVLGFEPVGVLDYRGAVSAVDGLGVVGSFGQLDEAIAATGAKQVLMLELPFSAEDMEKLTKVCMARGCRLMVHNNLVVKLEHPLRAFSHDGYSFLEFHDEPLEDPLNRSLKRALDLAVAVPVVIFILPPLTALVKLMQLLQSSGGVFYRQVRTGMGGKSFAVWKFRTMSGPGLDDAQQAQKDDSRIYPFGKILRRTSLDEIPQFLNVLWGEMSVVGPRPHMVDHEPGFARSAEVYRMRFIVAPGITGLAQSRGFRGEATSPADIQQRIRLDLIYVRTWSIWLDLAIMVRTLGQMLKPPNSAY